MSSSVCLIEIVQHSEDVVNCEKHDKIVYAMIASQLLRTRLYIPRLRREQVPRPRLVEQLNAALACRLTSFPLRQVSVKPHCSANGRMGAVIGSPGSRWMNGITTRCASWLG
jgi:hypothetical protein